MRTQLITAEKVAAWQQQYEIVYGDVNKVRILRDDNTIYKFLWRNDSLLTRDRLHPAALRFCHNSRRLKRKQVKAPDVEQLFYCKQLRLYIATYPLLTGLDLRHLAGQDSTILQSFAKYLFDLHQQGVFFRGIHLGNVLSDEHQQMALIDISDLRLFPMALPTAIRLRNLKHLFNNADDKQLLRSYGVKKFLQHYCSHGTKKAAKPEVEPLYQALQKRLKP